MTDIKTYSITQILTMSQSNITFALTIVYGPADSGRRAELLDELTAIHPPANLPWICVGDFNQICEAQDKNNDNINRSQMRRFRRALDTCELMEIKLQNRKYTWSNGQRNPTLVHLDRFFCNRLWDDVFLHHSLQALSSSLSDHCPLSLCNQDIPPRPAIFRFELFWAKVPGFQETVQQAWQLNVPGNSPLMKLHNRFKNAAKSLKEWSKLLFSQARLQLMMANEVIQRLEVAQESRQLSDAEVKLLSDLKHQVLG